MKTRYWVMAAAATLLMACEDRRGETMMFTFHAVAKKNAASERGCHLRGKPGVIFYRSAGQHEGVVNWGNSDVRMIGKKVADFTNLKVGDTREERYDIHGTTVTIQWKATKVCAPEDKSCDRVEMVADLSLEDPHGSTSFKASGACRL
jgi:hypothetical protein